MNRLKYYRDVSKVWLNRINGENISNTAWQKESFAECRKMHHRTSAVLKEILDHQGENLFKPCRYKNFSRQTYKNELHDILLNVLNHGTNHRAQIAQEIRRVGLEPINTDYIHFVRML